MPKMSVSWRTYVDRRFTDHERAFTSAQERLGAEIRTATENSAGQLDELRVRQEEERVLDGSFLTKDAFNAYLQQRETERREARRAYTLAVVSVFIALISAATSILVHFS